MIALMGFNVYAENPKLIYVKGDYIYSTIEDTVTKEIEGMTYNEETNTLTVENVKLEEFLYLFNLGEDFKLNLVGNNEMVKIIGYDTSLTIVGEGTLIVDSTNYQDDTFLGDYAIRARKVVVSNESTVKLFANEAVIDIYDSKNQDNLVILMNGDDISKNIVTEEYSRIGDSIYAGLPSVSDPYHFSHLAIKDGKKYGIESTPDGKYKRYEFEILKDPVNDIYFCDLEDNLNPVEYNNLAELSNAGYEIIDEETNVIIYNPRVLMLYEDAEKNKYGVLYSVDNDKIYELSTNFYISSFSPEEHVYYAKERNDINIDSLDEVIKNIIYETKLNLTELIVEPKKVDNPYTKSQKLFLATILSLVLLTVSFLVIKKRKVVRNSN